MEEALEEWFPLRQLAEQPCGELDVEPDGDFRPPLRRNDYRWNLINNTFRPVENQWVRPFQPGPEWWRFQANDRVIDAQLLFPAPIVPGFHMNRVTVIFQILYRRLIAALNAQNRPFSLLFRLEGVQVMMDTGMDLPQTWFGQIHHNPRRSAPSEIDRSFYCNLYHIWQSFISRQNGAITGISIIIIPLEEQELVANVPLRNNPFQGRQPVVRDGNFVNLGNYRTNLQNPSFSGNLQRREGRGPMPDDPIGRQRVVQRRGREEDDEPGPSRRRRRGGANTTKKEKKFIGPYACLSWRSLHNNCLFVNMTRGMKGYKPDAYSFDPVRDRLGIPRGIKIDLSYIPRIAEHYHIHLLIMDIDGEVLCEGGPMDASTVKLLLHDEHYWLITKEQKVDIKCGRCGRTYKWSHECNPDGVSFYQTNIHCNRIGWEDTSKKKKKKQQQEEEVEFQEDKCLYFDMETFLDPEENTHVPYAIGWFDGEAGYTARYGKSCLADFIDYLDKNPGKILVAYNGSRFDFHILLREYLKRETPIGNMLFHGGRLLQAEIGTHRLFDLCLFTSCSLASACKNFGVSAELHKSVFPHRFIDSWEKLEYRGEVPGYELFFYKPAELITDDDRQLIDSIYPDRSDFDVRTRCLDYLRLDVLGMRDVMLKFGELVKIELKGNLIEFMTLGQLTYSQWKKTLKKEICFARSEADYHQMREAYYGGRVYPVKRAFTSSQYEGIKDGSVKFEDITDYISDQDVNSLYPHVMKHYPYPIGDYQHEIRHYQMVEPFINIWAICKVQYKPPPNLLHPVLPHRTKSGLLWDLVPRSGWFTSVDLNLALAQGYYIYIEESYVWFQGAYIFDEYLSSTIAIKDAGTVEKNPVKRQIGKLLSNSLYGKFAQSPMANVYEVCRTEQELHDFCVEYKTREFYVVGDAVVLTGEKTDGLVIDRPHFIGAFITAYSRMFMYEYFTKSNPEGTTADSFYYTDTDSIHIPSRCLPRLEEDRDPVQLGKLSNDIKGEGKVIKAFYVAPKLYYLEYVTADGTGGQTIKSKGVNPTYMDDRFFTDYGEDYSAIVEVDMGLRLKATGLREPILQHSNIPLSRTLNKTPWAGRCWNELEQVWYPWTESEN